MRITILNLADKFVLKFKRLFYAQVSEVLEVFLLQACMLPIRHESLSILLYVAQKTSHFRRTTPPSHIKRWCCFLRKWVGPFATEWSAMVASTFSSFKTSSCFVWNFEGRWTYSGRLGQSFGCFSQKNNATFSSFLYIKWHTFLVDFSKGMDFLAVTEQGVGEVTLSAIFSDSRCHMLKRTPYTGAHTSHTSRYSYIDYS